MKIQLESIGTVRGGRVEVIDDDWEAVCATIEIDAEKYAQEALAGLTTFSHLVVIFHFHQTRADKIVHGARHPRGNPDWPKVGIFAQRAKNRPNLLGVSNCRILGVEGLHIHVQGLDAIDGSPVLDLKPHMTGFEPRGPVHEPDWAQEIMADYW